MQGIDPSGFVCAGWRPLTPDEHSAWNVWRKVLPHFAWTCFENLEKYAPWLSGEAGAGILKPAPNNAGPYRNGSIALRLMRMNRSS